MDPKEIEALYDRAIRAILKAVDDMNNYGTGVVLLHSDGRVEHVPLANISIRLPDPD